MQRSASRDDVRPEVPASVYDILRGHGAPLDAPIRRLMESRFGHDFSAVRIHADARADESARALNAHAYAVGREVVFASGQFRPETPSGRRLLAHELAHVAQDDRARVAATGPLELGDTSSAAEAEAESIARRIDEPPALAGGHHRSLLAPRPVSGGSNGVIRMDSRPFPKTITIGSEQVKVGSKNDEKEAKRIFDLLQKQYGIEIDSAKVLEALVATSISPPATQLLKTSVWEISELQALERGLARFKAVLGPFRSLSARSTSSQELTRVGRLERGLNPSRTWTSSSVMGQFFDPSDSAALYDAAVNNPEAALADQSASFEGTVIHEAAHAIFGSSATRFVQEISPPFWKDETTAQCPELEAGKHYSVWERARLGGPPYCYKSPGPEPPITPYGRKNAGEDLAEAVMFFFLEQATLQQRAPQRFRIVKKLVDSLQPPSPTPGPTP